MLEVLQAAIKLTTARLELRIVCVIIPILSAVLNENDFRYVFVFVFNFLDEVSMHLQGSKQGKEIEGISDNFIALFDSITAQTCTNSQISIELRTSAVYKLLYVVRRTIFMANFNHAGLLASIKLLLVTVRRLNLNGDLQDFLSEIIGMIRAQNLSVNSSKESVDLAVFGILVLVLFITILPSETFSQQLLAEIYHAFNSSIESSNIYVVRFGLKRAKL